MCCAVMAVGAEAGWDGGTGSGAECEVCCGVMAAGTEAAGVPLAALVSKALCARGYARH